MSKPLDTFKVGIWILANITLRDLFIQLYSPKIFVFTVIERCVLFLNISVAFAKVMFSKFCPFISITFEEEKEEIVQCYMKS